MSESKSEEQLNLEKDYEEYVKKITHVALYVSYRT